MKVKELKIFKLVCIGQKNELKLRLKPIKVFYFIFREAYIFKKLEVPY